MKSFPAGSLAAAALVSGMAVSGGAFAPAGQVAAGSVLAALAAALVLGGRTGGRLEAAAWSVVAWAAADVVLVGSWYLGGKEVVGTWAGAVVLLALVRRGGASWRDEVLAILAFGGVSVAVGLLLTALDGGTLRTGGVFENPNVAAAVLVPLALVLVARGGRPARSAAAAVALGVGLSGSRAGYLALAVGLVLSLPSRGARRAAALAGAAAGALLVWWRFVLHADALAWYRPHIWWAVLRRVAADPLLGVGPGNLADATGVVRLTTPTGCALHARRIVMAESTFLGFLAAVGIVGVLVAVLGLVAARREVLSAPLLRDRPWRGVVASLLLLAALHDFVEVPVVLWWWAVLVGLGLGPPEDSGGEERNGPRRPGLLLPAVTAGALVVWSLVLPPWVRSQLPGGEDPAEVLAVLRLEPLDDLAARRRAAVLLGSPGTWGPGQAGEALFWAEHVAEVHGGAASSWALLGRVHARLLRDLGLWEATLDRAREAFGRATRLEPRLPWTWLEWARLERAVGETRRARELAVRAVEAEPNCVGGWLLLARLDLDLGLVERARGDLDRAREARRCLEGRALESYERALAAAPPWQWRELEEALR